MKEEKLLNLLFHNIIAELLFQPFLLFQIKRELLIIITNTYIALYTVQYITADCTGNSSQYLFRNRFLCWMWKMKILSRRPSFPPTHRVLCSETVRLRILEFFTLFFLELTFKDWTSKLQSDVRNTRSHLVRRSFAFFFELCFLDLLFPSSESKFNQLLEGWTQILNISLYFFCGGEFFALLDRDGGDWHDMCRDDMQQRSLGGCWTDSALMVGHPYAGEPQGGPSTWKI